MRRLIEDIKSMDRRAMGALILAAFVLVTLQFRGKATYWLEQPFVRQHSRHPLEVEFLAQMLWAASTVVLFAILPFLYAVGLLRMRPREFGFQARGFIRHLPVYLGLYLVMLPFIHWASLRPDFLQTYPFASLARTSPRHFWIWEVAYFLQFGALEMFFRGFLLFSLERRFGLNAIGVMVIPYAMIHFSKPMPEAFGAIFAGLLLGYLALRTRSFYGGILLHYAVALTMDLMARSSAVVR